MLSQQVVHTAASRAPDAGMNLRFAPGQVLKVMLGIIAVLTIAGTVSEISKSIYNRDYVWGLVPLFNLDREGNIPTYYSALALLAAAIAAFLIGRIASVDSFRWKLMAAFIFYVSVDEASHIHELLNEPVQLLFNAKGIFFYGWVVVAIPIALVLAAAYIPFVRRLPIRIAGLMIASAVLVIGGGVVLEMIGAPWAERYGIHYAPYRFLTVAEEALEMVGVAMFTYALLTHLQQVLAASERKGFVLTVEK